MPPYILFNLVGSKLYTMSEQLIKVFVVPGRTNINHLGLRVASACPWYRVGDRSIILPTSGKDDPSVSTATIIPTCTSSATTWFWISDGHYEQMKIENTSYFYRDVYTCLQSCNTPSPHLVCGVFCAGVESCEWDVVFVDGVVVAVWFSWWYGGVCVNCLK